MEARLRPDGSDRMGKRRGGGSYGIARRGIGGEDEETIDTREDARLRELEEEEGEEWEG